MTPLDMATCAAAAWAGTATVVGIGACVLAEYQRRWKAYWANEADDNLELWRQALNERAAARFERDAANKRWSRAMHLLRTAEKQNRALVDAQLAGELERLVE